MRGLGRSSFAWFGGRSWWIAAAIGVGGASGCDFESDVAPEDQAGRARLLALVDVEVACDLAGIVELELRARRLACTDDGACELPPRPATVSGDHYFCPAANDEELLGVAVGSAGTYVVDLVFHFVSDLPTTECFTDPGGWVVEVDEDDVAQGRSRRLRSRGEPCREPEQ